jgi:putative two-component system response regulator
LEKFVALVLSGRKDLLDPTEIMQGSSRKILIVDDDVAIVRLLRRLLAQEYCLAEANSGEEALAMLDRFPADLVMLDIMMPGIDGYETCRRIRMRPLGRTIQVVMVSANSSRGEQVRAYAAGADDYVAKPFDPHTMCSRVRLHFRLRGALDTAASAGGYGLRPDAAGEDDARALFLAHAHDVTAAALTKVAELRDTETGEHLVRMRSYAQIIAEELGCRGPYAEQIDERFLDDLYRASPLHDIGKVGINDAILLKPGRLTPEEFETMKQHATIGANILDHMAFGAPDASFLAMAATIARFHHERFDGRGYPAGLRGTEIPLPARIVALADAYDAITSLRSYKAPQPAVVARDIIARDAGSHFDPVVVDAFLQRFETLASAFKQAREQTPVVIGGSAFLSAPMTAVGV